MSGPSSDSLLRGARLKCPACGSGAMFRRYLKVADNCPACGEELHHHRADDAPPYFTIVIVGHIVVSLVLLVEMTYRPPLWVHVMLWLPLTVALALLLLPPSRVRSSACNGRCACTVSIRTPRRRRSRASIMLPSTTNPRTRGGTRRWPPRP